MFLLRKGRQEKQPSKLCSYRWCWCCWFENSLHESKQNNTICIDCFQHKVEKLLIFMMVEEVEWQLNADHADHQFLIFCSTEKRLFQTYTTWLRFKHNEVSWKLQVKIHTVCVAVRLVSLKILFLFTFAWDYFIAESVKKQSFKMGKRQHQKDKM